MNTPGGRSLDWAAATPAIAASTAPSRSVRYMTMLLLCDGLEVGETGGEIVADHLVHIHEDAHHLEYERTRPVHRPGDGRVVAGIVAGRVEGEFGGVVAFERLQEIEPD